MNSSTLQSLLALAKAANKSKDWDITAQFLQAISPETVIDLCEELIRSRAGQRKRPSVTVVKSALESIFPEVTFMLDVSERKNGYVIRVAERKDTSTGEENEKYKLLKSSRENDAVTNIKSRLLSLAQIPTWRLSVTTLFSVDEEKIMFKYSRENPHMQLAFVG